MSPKTFQKFTFLNHSNPYEWLMIEPIYPSKELSLQMWDYREPKWIWVRLSKREPVEMKNGKFQKCQKCQFLCCFIVFRICLITCKKPHDKIYLRFWMAAYQSSALLKTKMLFLRPSHWSCSAYITKTMLPIGTKFHPVRDDVRLYHFIKFHGD